MGAPITVAAVQACPVFLDRAATVARCEELIAKAAAEQARLIVFPETFVPGYPDWVWRTPAWSDEATALYEVLFDQAVEVPGPETEALAAAATAADAFVAVGVNERLADRGTLFNTTLVFSPDGALVSRHRKLMPTGGERLIWGMGDGSTLDVIPTPFGRVSGLICWENYMPLARAALYERGVDVWLAPTWAQGDAWIATMRHIAREGRVFVLGVGQVIRGSDLPASIPGRGLWGGDDDWLNRGWSVIVDPEGEILAGPELDREVILTARIDPAAARRSRGEFDPVGHYARPDVLRVLVDGSPRSGAPGADPSSAR
jgi:nitrilase